MSYASGGLIQATDYNNFAWGGTQGTYANVAGTPNIAWVMGVGKGVSGYGQNLSAINTVSSSGVVTAVQWAGLVYTLNQALAHQNQTQLGGGLGGANINMTTGQTITYFSNVQTAVSQINTTANSAVSNGSTYSSSAFTTSVTFTQTTGCTAPQTSSFTHTATFSSGADAARYFFNAGGYITYTITATNVNGTLKSADLQNNWATFQGGGTIRGASSTPRSGSGGTVNTGSTSLGYWQLTTSPQVLSKITSTNYRYEYTQDYTQVSVQTNGLQGSNADNGTVITWTFLTSDEGKINSSDPANFNDNVSVNVTVTYTVYPPESTYLTNSWGTITFA
jgi:hypothetical protein